MGVSNIVNPDQGRPSVGLGLDPDCLHVNSLNISEEMLDAPLENFVVFWGELIDKYKDINANSKTVFTDYAMLKLEHIVSICFYYSVNKRWAWLKKILLNSENWDLAGTYYHIDAMHAGNQLNRSERFT